MPNTAQTRRPLILCVEDNPKYLALRQSVLEKNGYAVISANSSAEALTLARRFHVSLVISDHLLGGTTGAQLATEIKNMNGNVPVLLYSGDAPEHMADGSCFLKKDEPVEVFLALVNDLIRRYHG